VEVVDLIRCLNSIIFLSHTVRDYSELNLNRIETHPVENLFGLVRVACHSDHSWDRFLAAIDQGRLMDEIPSLNDIKPPHCRDFSVAGVKTSDPNDQIEHLVIPELRDRGVSYADYLARAMTQSATRKAETVESNVFDHWAEILHILIHWKNGRPWATLYSPAPIASDTALSRIINFTTVTPVFRWTKRR
jgi:hypothetical protein